MKKLLGISLVAVLAATPLMAMAEQVAPANPNGYNIAAADTAQTEAGANVPMAGGNALFKGKAVTETDEQTVATGAYVKGAYNAAISAVNKVASTVSTGKQDKLTAKDGIDISVNQSTGETEIKVDVASSKGLVFDANGQLQIDAGDGLNFDNSGKIIVDAKQDGGITADSTGVYLTNGIQGATDTTNFSGTGLTTKGYVDEAIDNLSIGDYATKTGVVNTIESATVDIIDGVSVSGGVTAYTDWANESHTTTLATPSLTTTRAYKPVVITATADSATPNVYDVKYHESKVSVQEGTAGSHTTVPYTTPVSGN